MGQKRCPTCRGMGFVHISVRGRRDYATCDRCVGTGKIPDSKEPTPETVELLRIRSGGICELCHAQPATDKHHRRFRSREGDHSIENLLHVCGPGNAFGCHADCHGFKPPAGTVISRYEVRPASEIYFEDKRGVRWVLNTDGTKEQVGIVIAVPETKGVWDL